MKKIVIISLFSIVLLITTLLSLDLMIAFCSLENDDKYTSSMIIDKDNNLLKTTNSKIKILQLTDIQISSDFDAGKAFRVAKKIIKKTTPDLIVLTGDNLGNKGKEKHVKRISSFMDSFEIPWALVYGNHDHSSKVTMNIQNQIYNNSKYGLFNANNQKNNSKNYFYNIQKNDEIFYTLLFMDSQEEGFIDDDILWYESTINDVAKQANKIIPSLLFFHIPIPELEQAYDAYKTNSNIGSGKKREDFCVQFENIGLLNKAKELKSTKAFIYGHDHINDLIIEYENILFCYGLKTGRTSYFKTIVQGGNLFTIQEDSSIKVERIYYF